MILTAVLRNFDGTMISVDLDTDLPVLLIVQNTQRAYSFNGVQHNNDQTVYIFVEVSALGFTLDEQPKQEVTMDEAGSVENVANFPESRERPGSIDNDTEEGTPQ